jgi:hypothetical protein
MDSSILNKILNCSGNDKEPRHIKIYRLRYELLLEISNVIFNYCENYKLDQDSDSDTEISLYTSLRKADDKVERALLRWKRECIKSNYPFDKST